MYRRWLAWVLVLAALSALAAVRLSDTKDRTPLNPAGGRSQRAERHGAKTFDRSQGLWYLAGSSRCSASRRSPAGAGTWLVSGPQYLRERA